MSNKYDDVSNFINTVQTKRERNIKKKQKKPAIEIQNFSFYPTENKEIKEPKEIRKNKIKNYIAEKKREWTRSTIESSSFSENSTKEIDKQIKKLEKVTMKEAAKLESKLKRFQSHINNLNENKETEKENKNEFQMPLPKVNIETIEIAEHLIRKIKEKIDLKKEKQEQMKEKQEQMKENKETVNGIRYGLILDGIEYEKTQSIFQFLKSLYELQNFVDSKNLNNSQKKAFIEKLEQKLEYSPTSEKTISYIFKNLKLQIENVPLTKNYYQNYKKKITKTINNNNLDQVIKTFKVGKIVAYLRNYKLEDFSGNLIIDEISQLIYLKNKKRKKWESRNKIPVLRAFDTKSFALALTSDVNVLKNEILQDLKKITNQKQFNIYRDRDIQIREIAVKSFQQNESTNQNPEKEISLVVQLASQVILKKLLQECVIELNKLDQDY
ncbi:hypothetical protein M0813_06496 [Anaeramoeba flamelloides]|uniref:Uncharacterized protein n=1 Tax=Anaeramoeba flamelloides TaxID=1746091 RepID=A0ABQ8XDH7_9EUKA|nr:hypothetical protein M0813_06496 [Anaeramoeba flamelloides]